MKKIKMHSLAMILKRLRLLESDVESRYKTKIIGLFGSIARGDAKASSDIDILVQPKQGASLVEFIGLGDFLKEQLGRKVDVVSENALKERVKPYIYKDLIRL